MTELNFTNLITKFKLTPDTWIRPTFIKEICLSCDGNLAYNWLHKKLYFDTVEKNLKVKYSDIKLCSDLIENVSKVSSNVLKVKPIIQNIISRGFMNMHIRSIAPGDIIYTVDKKTGTIVDSTEVKDVEINEYRVLTVTLKEDLDISGYHVCYCLGDKFDSSYNYGSNYIYRMYDFDYTEFMCDQVIFLKYISGISMR